MARTPPATTTPQNHHPHPSVLWDDTASAHAAVPHHHHQQHAQNGLMILESDGDPRRRPPDTVVEEDDNDDDDTTSHMSIYSSASWYKSEGSELPIRRYPLQPQRGRRSTAQNEQLSPSRSPARQRRQGGGGGGRPASANTAISSSSNSPLRHRRRTPTTPPTQTTTPATHSTTTTERSHKSESVTRSAQHPKKTDETENDPFLPSETTEGNSSSSSSLFQKSWFSTWTHSKDGDHHTDKSRSSTTRDGSSNNEEEEVILVQQQDYSQKETDDEALVIKEETTAAVLVSPNSTGGFPYPPPPDPSQFKARPVPKSTYEYHPPHASFNYLRPNPPDAHSLDPPPFKARPLPKTTYEYHGPEPIAAAATPTAESEGTILTSPMSSTTTTTTTPRGSASVASSTKSTTTTSSTGKTRIPTPGSGGSTASTTTNNSSQKRPHTPSSLLRRRGAAASAMTSPSSVLSSSSSSLKTPLSSMRPRSEGTPSTKSLTQKFAHLDQQTTTTITNHNKIVNTNNKGSRLRSPDGANNNSHSKTSSKNVKEPNSSSQASPSLVDSILLQEAGDDDDDFVDLRVDYNSPKSKHKDRRPAPLDKTKNNNKGSKPSLSSTAEPHKKDIIQEKETPILSLVPDMEEETTSRTMGRDPPHLNGSVISEHLEDVGLYNDDDEDDTDVDGVHIPFDKEEDDEGDFKFRMSYTRFWKNLLAAIILPYLMCRSILEMEYDHFLWELRKQQHREQQQHFPHAPIRDSIPVQEHQEVWFERSSSTMEQLIILEQDDKDENKDMATPDQDPIDNDSVSPPRNFPLPKLPEGKRPPKAVYTSQSFVMQSVSFGGAACLQGSESLDNVASNRETWSSLSMQSQYHVNVHLDHSTIEMDEYDEYMIVEDDGEEELFDEVHEPSGQHLLVDISNVAPKFLTDMEQLAKSMIALTEQSQLTLLSYHCHEWSGAGAGVSCMGVLLESHLSLHTWPSAGILSLDLFTCGSKSLLPLVPLIQDLFAVSTKSHGNNNSNHTGSTDQANYSQFVNDDMDWLISPPPVMRWLHKKRGFRGQHYKMQQTSISDHRESHAPRTVVADEEDRVSAELGHKSAGLEAYLLGWMGYQEKKLLVNVQTPFQHVQIYEASLLATVPPLSRHAHSSFSSYSVAQGRPNARGSNKVLYLDGAMRSSLYGLEAYHEALVQPALIAHPAPQRIAIVGGGEGATLREVLKHSTTVTEVVMIEQDGTLVELAREYLREWNDCTQLWDMQQDKTCLASNSTSCFDDPRVKLFVEDAFAWFVERYGRNASKKGHGYEKFDVIILDAL